VAATVAELDELIAKPDCLTVLAATATVLVAETSKEPLRIALAATVMALVSLMEAAPRLTP
jgi:hypothetical protein